MVTSFPSPPPPSTSPPVSPSLDASVTLASLEPLSTPSPPSPRSSGNRGGGAKFLFLQKLSEGGPGGGWVVINFWTKFSCWNGLKWQDNWSNHFFGTMTSPLFMVGDGGEAISSRNDLKWRKNWFNHFFGTTTLPLVGVGDRGSKKLWSNFFYSRNGLRWRENWPNHFFQGSRPNLPNLSGTIGSCFSCCLIWDEHSCNHKEEVNKPDGGGEDLLRYLR